jgi:hypothetical protein
MPPDQRKPSRALLSSLELAQLQGIEDHVDVDDLPVPGREAERGAWRSVGDV